VHSVQFQTFGNLSDYSHIQIASFVLNNTDPRSRRSTEK